MKKIKTTFLCGIVIVTVLNCATESTPSSTNHLGESFTIKTNESTQLMPYNLKNASSDSSLSVNFEKVICDSRCPKASCHLCYGSTAQIQILLTHHNIQSSIQLTILGCQDEYECNDQLYYRKDTLGYRICLLRLDPYPTGTPVNSKNYTAKLNISKL
jgi:hypothetical protein